MIKLDYKKGDLLIVTKTTSNDWYQAGDVVKFVKFASSFLIIEHKGIQLIMGINQCEPLYEHRFRTINEIIKD